MSNISWISSVVMMSGGQKATESWMLRTMRPSSCMVLTVVAPTIFFGSKARLRRLVGDEFDGADEADAARLADQRMVGQLLQARLEDRRHLRARVR